MTDKSRTERILEDLALRELGIGGIIALNREGQIVCLSYDANGLVSKISQGENVVALYGKTSMETRGMRELFTLGVKE